MTIKFILITVFLIALGCNGSPSSQDKAAVKAEIMRLLEIQELAYDNQTDENKKKFRDTCMDSLIFIGGDDGGMMRLAGQYVEDFADGYIEKPHDRVFQIYDNTAIVTSLYKAFVMFGPDTLYVNARSTKIFVKERNAWKMAYVTFAPVPVLHHKTAKVDPSKLARYAGTYNVMNLTDSVFVENGRLYSDVAHSGKAELIPINDSTFVGEGYFGRAVFAGNHYTFEWNDGQRIRFKRIK